jgi:hypothetical protein
MTNFYAAEIEPKATTTNPPRAPRRTIDLESLSLSSYVSLCTLISICLGLVVGILFFILDLLVLNTTTQWSFIGFEDNEMGLVVLFVGPFLFGVTGLVGSLFSYRIFLWALRKFWGLQLTGTWKELENPEGPNNIHHSM